VTDFAEFIIGRAFARPVSQSVLRAGGRRRRRDVSDEVPQLDRKPSKPGILIKQPQNVVMPMGRFPLRQSIPWRSILGSPKQTTEAKQHAKAVIFDTHGKSPIWRIPVAFATYSVD
jgi:hypothetical protein